MLLSTKTDIITRPNPVNNDEKLSFVTSNKNEVNINLGYYKNKSNNQSYYNNTFLSHNDSMNQSFNHTTNHPIISSTHPLNTNTISNDSVNQLVNQVTSYSFNPTSNLSNSKFGKGFYRRPANQIVNQVSEMHNTIKESMSNHIENHHQQRKQYLNIKDKSNGYNIINNQSYNDIPTTNNHADRSSKRIIGDGLTPYTVKKGQAILKESTGRYHAPTGSGDSFDKRQHTLVNEGVYTARCSSILQLGKKDLVSYGIEDQFSKSNYIPLNESTSYGLAEKREPGRFTPRKQINNPAGKPNIVQNWTKTIDINNNTLRGIL